LLSEGQKFGRLTVVKGAGSDKHQRILYECRCDCGTFTVVLATLLRTGRTQSCGCLRLERSIEAAKLSNRTHGMKQAPEYRTWCHMKERCSNSSCSDYRDYGGRGITVCERWKNSFENFYADIGPRPSPKHSIDRIDSNGNYEPGNCRWATPLQQSRNRDWGNRLEFRGETRRVSEWAEVLGVRPGTLHNRIRRGWPIERILAGGADLKIGKTSLVVS